MRPAEYRDHSVYAHLGDDPASPSERRQGAATTAAVALPEADQRQQSPAAPAVHGKDLAIPHADGFPNLLAGGEPDLPRAAVNDNDAGTAELQAEGPGRLEQREAGRLLRCLPGPVTLDRDDLVTVGGWLNLGGASRAGQADRRGREARRQGQADGKFPNTAHNSSVSYVARYAYTRFADLHAKSGYLQSGWRDGNIIGRRH